MDPRDPFQNSAVIDWLEVEKAVEAFESARITNRDVQIRDFLPSADDPLYERVLREMIRVELEAAWSHGAAVPLEHFRTQFPTIFDDLDGLRELAFEEYRLRRLAGENVTPAEYERRYGIDAADWPEWNRPLTKSGSRKPATANDVPVPRNPSLEAAAQSYLRLRLDSESVSVDNLNSWRASCTAEPEKAEFFRDLHLSAPEKASVLAEGLAQLPEAGTEFLGFRLISELGRGAFGRVYLAKQGDLAGRSVALKVAADVFDESQTLAKLQHTNIVPIYSIHKSGQLQAVCMPYFGTTTLADILTHVESQPSIPDSGMFVVSTLNNRRVSTHRQDGKSGKKFEVPLLIGAQPQTIGEAIPETVEGEGILHQLAGYSYAQAVLWMASQLADGLHHAHERGILHRDLKPANILLTDEGQPMLLDFNLSADLKSEAHRATVGGTLPYMAPEHLEAFRGRDHLMDARSDLYALGVMMYELLAGKRPFPTYRGESDAVLSRLIDDRLKGAPSLRQHNPAVTPAMDAIVRRCLMARPADRYQTAGELHEDLERQLKNLPLKHTKEPSLNERCRKWMRRHPRLASTTSVGIAAIVLILMLGTGLVLRDRQVAHLQASDNLRHFRDELPDAQFWLSSKHQDAEQLRKGDEACRKALARYELPQNPDWQTLPVVRNLSAKDRDQLQGELGELLLLLGKSTSLQADYYTAPQEKEEKFQLAMNLTSLAESCYGPNTPRALFEQREILATKLGKEREAQALSALLRDFDRQTPRDNYLKAHRLVIDGNYRQALSSLRTAAQENPTSFPTWFVRGNCLFDLVRFGEAIGCYNVCVALRPDFAPSWQNRGKCYLELRNYRQAVDDYTKAIELQPDSWEALFNRSQAKKQLNDLPGALQDLESALKTKDHPPRLYYFRADIRGLLGDTRGAEEDRKFLLAAAPQDDEDWMTLGFAKIPTDPKAALADFDKALELNPRSFKALQNKGALLSQIMHRDNDSLAVMNDAVRLFPDSALTRGGRGVLLARMGKRAEAIADAEEALLQDNEPSTLYQVACIYALTSKTEKVDQVKAMTLLTAAIRTGFGLEGIDTDTDLDPIRQSPEFVNAVRAARALASGAQQPNAQ
jgi:serine/threonine protein kinase/Flp pilus assembly protein TadD